MCSLPSGHPGPCLEGGFAVRLVGLGTSRLHGEADSETRRGFREGPFRVVHVDSKDGATLDFVGSTRFSPVLCRRSSWSRGHSRTSVIHRDAWCIRNVQLATVGHTRLAGLARPFAGQALKPVAPFPYPVWQKHRKSSCPDSGWTAIGRSDDAPVLRCVIPVKECWL